MNLEELFITKQIIASILSIVVLAIFYNCTGIEPFNSFFSVIGIIIAFLIVKAIMEFIVDIVLLNLYK